jgi:hypothetical protein
MMAQQQQQQQQLCPANSFAALQASAGAAALAVLHKLHAQALTSAAAAAAGCWTAALAAPSQLQCCAADYQALAAIAADAPAALGRQHDMLRS